MKKLILILLYALFFSILPVKPYAQTRQTVDNGSSTAPINFGTSACSYNWVNNNSSIGLPAGGAGNIASFTAINTGNNPITATITGIPASQGYAYITNEGSGTISIISEASNTVVSTITPPHDAFAVCISPDGTKAYIGCGGGTATVSVINISTNTIISTISIEPAIAEATGLVISPDGSMLYVEDYQTGLVLVVSTSTSSVVATIGVGAHPYGIAISRDGSKVYIAYSFNNYISVINTATNNVTGTIVIGNYPSGIAMSPDGTRLYVVVSTLNHLAIIDPLSDKVTGTISTVSNPGLITLSPDGTTAYVVAGNNVSVISIVTGTTIATIPLVSYSNGISISPDGKFVYVTNGGLNSVSVINTATNTVIATDNVQTNPVSAGSFVSAGAGCPITPITATITVNPSTTIIASNVSGSINACYGSPSTNPNIQQFTVSGNNLAQPINATAPIGFELSLNSASGYSSGVMLTPSSGTVNSTIIYIRSSSSAAVGNISGNVVLSSANATNQSVSVNATINVIATVNTIASQTVTAGTATLSVIFTGTATIYNWINDSPGVGLATSGTGNIPSFIGTNNTNKTITAAITVYPLNEANCNGTPAQFNINVDPTPIFVVPSLSIPNTFTPNGDGVNDTWAIKNSEYYPTLTINVFNRWGQQLYSSIGYPIPWDGKFEGKVLAAGSYYYIINPRNGQIPVAGWLAIIR